MYTMDEYQKQAHGTALYNSLDGIQRFNTDELRSLCALSYCAHGLSGEAGEANEKIKKYLRGDHNSALQLKAELTKELGDCLWYIANMAKEIGLNLDEIARLNLEKLKDRKARGVLHGSGDTR